MPISHFQVYVDVRIRIHINMFVHLLESKCTHLHMDLYVQTEICITVYIFTFTHMHVHMTRVRMYACSYCWWYIQSHTFMNAWLSSTCSWFIPFRPEIKTRRGKYGMIEFCSSCAPIQSKRSRISRIYFGFFLILTHGTKTHHTNVFSRFI